MTTTYVLSADQLTPYVRELQEASIYWLSYSLNSPLLLRRGGNLEIYDATRATEYARKVIVTKSTARYPQTPVVVYQEQEVPVDLARVFLNDTRRWHVWGHQSKRAFELARRALGLQ